MKITFPKTQFLSNLFPGANLNDVEQLTQAIKDYYYPSVAQVQIEAEWVHIVLLENRTDKKPGQFYTATDLCMKRRYREAIPILEKLVSTNPQESEFHRNLGQAFEELGEIDRAVDCLIDALKWDPKNHWALLLMGNIFAKHKKDYDTAMTYFDQVVELDPQNHIVLSNIGGVFLQAGKMTLAEIFFKKANKANPDFPNALHGLGIVEHRKGNLLAAFELGIKGLKNASESAVRSVISGFVTNVASGYTKSKHGQDKVVEFLNELIEYTGKEILLEQDENIPVEAKLEVAEIHHRDFHRVVFKDAIPAIDHLIVHELTHLKFFEDARRDGVNQLFTSGALEFLRVQENHGTEYKQTDQKWFSGRKG